MFPIDIDFSRLLEAFKYNPDAPMIFSSGIFLWLFAAFMVIYTLLQHRNTARILFVALFSYYFYYKSSGTYFFLLAIVTVTDFVRRFRVLTCGLPLGLGFCVLLLFIIAIFYLVIDFQFGFSQSATIESGLPPLGSGARFFGSNGGLSDIFRHPER